MSARRRRIVIVGGGFGGVKLALQLARHQSKFKVTLISKYDFFEYHAALYRSATGWSPNEVVLPLTDIFTQHTNIEVVVDEVRKIDAEAKQVIGKSKTNYKYDDLVMAVGLTVNYFGVEGMAEQSYSLNTAKDSFKLRQHLRDAVITSHKTGEHLEFVVVGGGATGVELASELDFFLAELCSSENIGISRAHVSLVEGTSRLLSLLSPKASKYAQWRLQKLGVKVMLKTKVTGLSNDKLKLEHGEIPSKTVIWTAGATNHLIFSKHPKIFTLARNGRVEIDEYLRANKNIYVIGDNADTAYSGMAQTAISDATFVAKNFVRSTRGKKKKLYSPHQPIYAVPVGRDYAIVQWGRVVLRGRLAWLLRRVADLKLFMIFEPYRTAIKTWRSGNKRAKGFEVR